MTRIDFHTNIPDKLGYACRLARKAWSTCAKVVLLAEDAAQAAALNDAYRTLKDPLSRALYLAGLKGIELPGDGKTIDDPDLLTEVMDAREELQEASSVGEVDALAKFAREDLEKGLAGLARLFQANDKKAIRKALLRLRYLDKFAEEARVRRANLK